MTEAIKTIGKLIEGAAERDAIHVAILPVTAAEDLSRGMEVGLVYGTTDQVKSKQRRYGQKPIGIVDPFLEDYCVPKGQRCWVFLFPGTVIGMRHHWSHPDIDQQREPATESERWLRKFADKWNFDYGEMVTNAQDNEGYVVAMGRDLHSRTELEPGDELEFWRHIEKLVGREFDENHRANFGWSCSC